MEWLITTLGTIVYSRRHFSGLHFDPFSCSICDMSGASDASPPRIGSLFWVGVPVSRYVFCVCHSCANFAFLLLDFRQIEVGDLVSSHHGDATACEIRLTPFGFNKYDIECLATGKKHTVNRIAISKITNIDQLTTQVGYYHL